MLLLRRHEETRGARGAADRGKFGTGARLPPIARWTRVDVSGTHGSARPLRPPSDGNALAGGGVAVQG